jgi:hypothetical protein
MLRMFTMADATRSQALASVCIATLATLTNEKALTKYSSQLVSCMLIS